MTTLQLCGAVAVMILIIIFGVTSGRNVKTSSDFESGGSKSGYTMVTGMIMGTIVGGSCTIGTAQLAYSSGLSAWWYTLSSALGCILLALFYVKPFRNASTPTLVGILRKEYGIKVDFAVSTLYTLATLLAVAAQLISASTLLPYIFPNIPLIPNILLCAGLMLVYVLFGGALGAGKVGELKTILLYLSVIACVITILKTTSLQTFWNTLDHDTYFNLFFSGVGKECSRAVSMSMGIITAQSYMQAIRMARSDKIARSSEFISAALIVLIGFFCILIGLFMRVQHPNLANSKDAFPAFVLTYLPEWLSGIVMGTLLLTIIGSGASMALGASISISRDIVQPLLKRPISIHHTRACIVLYLSLACLLGTGILGDIILSFSSLGLGLRGAILFIPLATALWFPGKVHPTWCLIASIAAPLAVLLFSFWKVVPFDNMFLGILISTLCVIIGALAQKKRPNTL